MAPYRDGGGLHTSVESNATPREAWVAADAWGRRSWWRALAADASVVGPGGCGVVVMAGAGAGTGNWVKIEFSLPRVMILHGPDVSVISKRGCNAIK